MADVTLTSAMRANLLSLQQTANLLGTTQYRLATGNKVNSALDNPSSYFAAQGLNSRASDLSALLDGMGQSVQTLKAADNAITSMTTLLQSAKAIAQTAKTQPAGTVAATGTSQSFSSAQAADLTTTGLFDGTDGTASITLSMGNAATYSATGANNYTIEISSTGVNTLDGLISAINGISGFKAEKVVNGSNFDLKVTTTNGHGFVMSGDVGTSGTGTIGTILGNLDSNRDAAGTPADYSAQIAQYDDIRTQFDALINDAGYRGINLLKGDSLVTQFNETNTSSSSISSAQTFTAAGLGVTAASGNWSTVTDIDDAIQEISDAITTLKNEAAKFGNGLAIIQARQDYTTNLINVLKDGASALTIADKNEEGANLLALQTSQQLGIQALSLSSQANQSVLRLFS